MAVVWIVLVFVALAQAWPDKACHVPPGAAGFQLVCLFALDERCQCLMMVLLRASMEAYGTRLARYKPLVSCNCIYLAVQTDTCLQRFRNQDLLAHGVQNQNHLISCPAMYAGGAFFEKNCVCTQLKVYPSNTTAATVSNVCR
jgi:hypothetical protein